MKNKKTLLWFSLLTFSLFILLAFTFESSYLQAIDVFFVEGMPNYRHDWITSIMLFLAWLGGTRIMAVLTLSLLILLVIKHKQLTAAFLPILVMGGTGVLNLIAKQLISRVRPEVNYLIDQPGYSFPSGHTMAAVSLFGLIVYLSYIMIEKGTVRKLTVISAITLVVLMGASRVYLGVHFFTDIMGGTLFSLTWLMISIYLVESLKSSSASRSVSDD